MPIWTKEIPPQSYTKIGRKAVATDRGWEDARTGEILVAIPQLAVVAGQANIFSVLFDKAAYAQGDAINVVVRYNEKVNVTAGATLTVSWSGVSGNFVVTALQQSAVTEVVFSGTAPVEAGNLSIAAQTIVGTIVDVSEAGMASELAISSDKAAGAGTIAVA